MASHHVAQVNASLPREPLDSRRLADFVAALDPVNAVGEAAAGFIWRLQTEDGNATAVRFLDDDRIIVNLTVWESIEALGEFAFRNPAHLEVPSPYAFTFRDPFAAPDAAAAPSADEGWYCPA